LLHPSFFILHPSSFLRAAVLAAAAASAQEPPAPDAPPAPGTPAPTEGNPGDLLPDGTYIVKKGDTLWDLSQQFLSNPWYWPKIWADNPTVENPHWIYPANRLKIRSPGEGLPAQVGEGDEGDQSQPEPLPGKRREIADFTVGSIHHADDLGQDPDLVSVSGERHLGFSPRENLAVVVNTVLTPADLAEDGVIAGSFEEKALLTIYDQAYVRFHDLSKVRVGQTYTIYRPTGPVYHPVTHAVMGQRSLLLGTLRVVGKEAGLAVVMLGQVIEDVVRGDRVGPAITTARDVAPRPASRDVDGIIMGTEWLNQTWIGESYVVYLDRGSNDGVAPGNVFQVVHRGDGLGRLPIVSQYEDRSPDPAAAALPREVVATLMVYDVSPATSTALVLRSMREVKVGDSVLMRAPRRGAGGDAR